MVSSDYVLFESCSSKFEEREFNGKAMSVWLDDAVEVLDFEGLPYSAEAVRQLRIYLKEMEG